MLGSEVPTTRYRFPCTNRDLAPRVVSVWSERTLRLAFGEWPQYPSGDGSINIAKTPFVSVSSGASRLKLSPDEIVLELEATLPLVSSEIFVIPKSQTG